MLGVGSGGAAILSGMELETPPSGFTTVTAGDPGAAIIAAGMDALTRPALSNAV